MNPRHPAPRAALLATALTLVVAAPARAAGLSPAPFPQVHIEDSFWGPRIERNRKVTIEANLRQCEVTGRVKNFAVAGKLEKGQFQGLLFNDSDVYKVIEGVGYALADRRDAALERRVDDIIDKIAAAQQLDGYLNTYVTLVKPQDRWKNIQWGHELYCAGHLIEAAVAYYQSTGKRKLLDVARRFADHIDSVFGPDRRHDTCGHEEVELALVKLYRVTGERRYLELARFFINTRGTTDGRYSFGEYAQDYKPVREQSEVTGHAVRAMYLYSAMADVAGLTGDRGLWAALEKIWHDVVDRRMYVTGGIGPSASNEGFTVPYDLPNDTAYAETCAAIGMALWNHRLFLASGDGKYADVLEREVYNGLLSGVSLSGDRFFYVNPLGSKGNHHRVPWFDCSCCPTNVVRYVPGMGERVYASRGDAVWTILYLGSTAELKLPGGRVRLRQKTDYPWDGRIRIRVEPEKPFLFDLHLRVPGWCKASPGVALNGEALAASPPRNGYVTVSRTWKAGDEVALDLPVPVERVYADPHVKADVGRVALQRGPVVYCLEGVDNGGQVRNVYLPRESKLTSRFEKDLLGGVAVVEGDGFAVTGRDADEKPVSRPVHFRAVPYSTWDNRAPGPMVVWLAEKAEYAEVPGEDGVVSEGVRVRASHVNPRDCLSALNDGVLPKSSGDEGIPRMTWWDHRGTAEWVSYRFPKARRLSGSAVYWFADGEGGRCRVPAEWKLSWLDGGTWRPVKPTGGSNYGTQADTFNRVTFEPVTARELRLEVRLKPGYSGGILEWIVSGP